MSFPCGHSLQAAPACHGLSVLVALSRRGRGAPAVRLGMEIERIRICRYAAPPLSCVLSLSSCYWPLSGRKNSPAPRWAFAARQHEKPVGGKRGKGENTLPARAGNYATLNVRILVISLVSSLRLSPSSTHAWGHPLSS